MELGVELPAPGPPKANYNMFCFSGPETMFLSGHLPIQADGGLITGRLGQSNMHGAHQRAWCTQVYALCAAFV